ncbi:FAD-dependent oxidoreductase [Micromonospora sp. CA-249363]|uniref:FAD-dependent oxidoreductase n=1 Tax=Micromonospora sp. CA-249363 TaxID=3239963 RepID=UPI003D93934B
MTVNGSVAIVGAGIVGAVAARCLAEAGVDVVLVEAGGALAEQPGTHLRNLPLCRTDRSFHFDLVRSCLRPASVRRAEGFAPRPSAPPMPAGYGINPAQPRRGNMLGARLTTVHGGMGVLWNCVSPRLHPSIEQWAGIPADSWERLYERAERLLSVGFESTAGSARQEYLIRRLAEVSTPRPAPLAARLKPDQPGAVRWTGPAETLADIASMTARARIRILANHSVTGLEFTSGRVTAARVVDLDARSTGVVRADSFVIAAGAVRTPALLWASGIGRGDASPLGRYLAEHPLAYAQVVLDPESLGDDRDAAGPDPCVVIPVSADRPFHSLLVCDGYDAQALEGRLDERLILSLYWYAAMESRFENRIAFGAGGTDALGLPQPTFEYVLSEGDGDRLRAALAELRDVGALLGPFLPGRPPQLLSPGSSMHLLGTTRMGLPGDAQSVVDDHGQVWGFDNLYLAGTGLLRTAGATNPTLAACALAVRTAERIVGG